MALFILLRTAFLSRALLIIVFLRGALDKGRRFWYFADFELTGSHPELLSFFIKP